MKKVIPIGLLALFFLGFSLTSFKGDAAEEALKKVASQFERGLEEMSASIGEYQAVAELLENDDASIQELKDAHLNTRHSYKKIEFLVEYFDPQSAKLYLNGAPLPSLEPNVPEIVVMEPTGLQILDELVFAEDPFAEKDAIVTLVNQLAKDFEKVKKHQSTIKLTHRHVFESVRTEIVRIYTLGVTGFDTPGSVNAIPEAKEAIQAIYTAMIPYLPVVKEENIGVAFQISGYFDITLEFLNKYDDFDTFDRMAFYRKAIEPLYQFMRDVHTLLGIEKVEDISDLPLAVNFEGGALFSDDFLNKAYYSNISDETKGLKLKTELGRLLFFDPILSKNNKRSCASCHQPEKAFTDGLPKSLAYNGKGTILRNAPTVINSLYADKYFYDLREDKIEQQVKHVFVDGKEFATDYNEIINKLKQSKEYQKLFKEAYKDYGKYNLTVSSVSNALACYVRSLTSFNSEFDKYMRNEISSIAPEVKRGYNLFMGKAACGTCHFAPTFNGSVPPAYEDSESEILGVPAVNSTDNPPLDPDWGRMASKHPVDESEIYKFSFKTVTVRNVELTAPYMHNGVYNTLEEVVDFYNRGGGAGMGMDLPYQTLPFSNLDLNEQESSDLVAFMKSLTDTTGMTQIPVTLPAFEEQPEWNNRLIGGEY